MPILLAEKGEQMSMRTLKRCSRSLGLNRKGNQFDDDHLRHVIQEEMLDAGGLAGYWSIWHALRLRHGIHISSHHVPRIMKEIDPIGVEERNIEVEENGELSQFPKANTCACTLRLPTLHKNMRILNRLWSLPL